MIRTLLSFFTLLALILASPLARADFEADLADTGKTDNITALSELRARATGGDADSQLNMGGLFFKGQAVEQDYAEAAKWFLLSARQGNAQAQFNLGMMYDTGQGVMPDHAQAVQWYRLAAMQGLASAQLNLGMAYAEGQGILQNEAEAVKWFRLAAVQGEAQAQFNLGVMYAKGQWVTPDLVESYRWTRLAAAQGHEMAKALIKDLVRHMTPEQQTSAGNLADKTQETPVSRPAASVSNDVYLQLGAFRSQNQAEKFMALLSAKLGDIGRPFSLFTNDGWVRIQVGPYASLSEARRSADNLKAKLGFEPLLKQR
ncbi:MAG TPA: SPOR domain-containing protein [Gallionella sp.]